MASEEFFHPDVLDVFNNVGYKLEKNDKLVPLDPHTSEDPFYIAQLRQKEIEKLQSYDKMPIAGTATHDKTPISVLMGQAAQEEINDVIPEGIRNQRLAISTFVLVILEAKTKKQIPYVDDEEFLISGFFDEFAFDENGRPRSLVVPLLQPRILKPRGFLDMSFHKVTIPVLEIADWELDMSTN